MNPNTSSNQQQQPRWLPYLREKTSRENSATLKQMQSLLAEFKSNQLPWMYVDLSQQMTTDRLVASIKDSLNQLAEITGGQKKQVTPIPLASHVIASQFNLSPFLDSAMSAAKFNDFTLPSGTLLSAQDSKAIQSTAVMTNSSSQTPVNWSINSIADETSTGAFRLAFNSLLKSTTKSEAPQEDADSVESKHSSSADDNSDFEVLSTL